MVPEHPHPPPSLRAEDEKSKHFGVNVLYILERKRPVKRYISRKHTQIFKPENKQCLHSLFTLAPAGDLRVTRLTRFQLLSRNFREILYSLLQFIRSSGDAENVPMFSWLLSCLVLSCHEYHV